VLFFILTSTLILSITEIIALIALRIKTEDILHEVCMTLPK